MLSFSLIKKLLGRGGDKASSQKSSKAYDEGLRIAMRIDLRTMIIQGEGSLPQSSRKRSHP